MMSPEWVDTAIKALTTLGGLAGSYAAWISRNARRGMASRADVDQRFAVHDDRYAAIQLRLGEVEAELRHLPTSDDLSRLSDRLGGVEGSVRETKEQVSGVSQQVGRVDRMVTMLVEHHIKERGSS